MALTQLIYISDVTDVVTLEDLLAIQAVSIRNNARRNITGILFHANGNFVQLLEGEQSDVLELFATVCEDPRHENIRLLYERSAQERVFEEWHMAMLDLELHSDVERNNLRDLVRHAEASVSRQNWDEASPKDVEVLYRFRELLMFV